MNNLEFAYINITNKCNLKCFYCYNEKAEVEKITLSIDVIKKVADDFKNLGVKRVAITGGEPFNNKKWFDIAKEFYIRNIEVVFSTNGTLVKNDDIKKLKLINSKLQISLDGDNETMYSISKGLNVYDKVINLSMKLLKNDIPFNLACVVGKHNLNQVDNLIEISDEFGINISFNFYSDTMNDHHKDLALNVDEKNMFIEKINMHNKNCNNMKRISIPLPPLLNPDYIYNEVNTGCGLARNVVGILANGDVTICGPASSSKELIAGNINRTRFIDIWNDSILFNELRKIKCEDLEGICKICPFKAYCLGSCRLTSFEKYKKFTGPGVLCQSFYERIQDDDSPFHEFPSKVMRYEKI